ncbi:multicopper oxidase domain-containing protein [Clostridium sp. YIM B02505]|uniref:Multicopper oxidase domain-containing protein n=1 Tax=Clostridium yunnanense TaxID=2800325 RepID=A0ABS1ER04_9CLOT|nr:multicopper oxidase domain-containing protein [Clostridium yunnanense]MBK1811822.1 multicopper oxidase domain-containing protein [Clostridium yunnanense]
MAVRHYVLLATDGKTKLPTSSELPPDPATEIEVLIYGFVGGLYKVDDKVVDENLNWETPKNLNYLYGLKGSAYLPSPIIWGEVGDKIYITLINLGMKYVNIMDPHTVHMHGAHVATQLDGFPELSFAVPMWEYTGSNKPETLTYYFYPEHPGTLMYHCHQEASEHVQMGMYGALIIYPSYKSLAENGIKKDKCGRWLNNGEVVPNIPRSATNRNFAYNNIHSFFNKEYIMLLSDIDQTWHDSILNGTDFNPVDYKPNFWLVNGRPFPYSLLPHPQTPPVGSDKDLSQLNYESYVHVKTGEDFLLRMINIGYQVIPWHVHGWHFRVIGKDSHISPFLEMNHMSSSMGNMGHPITEMGFTCTIGSGETYDLMINAENKSPIYRKYIVNGQDCIPSVCRQIDELKAYDPSLIAEIPTQPVNVLNINTTNYIDICDEPEESLNSNFFPQFYPMHNHDDYKVTNNGTYPGGQLTYIQVDAPEFGGLMGSYYANKNFTDLRLKRLDEVISFNWKTDKPQDLGETFSVRWTGKLKLPISQRYKLQLVCIGDGTVKLNGNEILKVKDYYSLPVDFETIDFEGEKQYEIEIKYVGNSKGAIALLWTSSTKVREVIPPYNLYPV